MPHKRLSDITGHGDDGYTDLLGGVRVPKEDARIEAFGAIDEASCFLGLARSLCSSEAIKSYIEQVQRDLYLLGAELATAEKVYPKYGQITEQNLERLNNWCKEIEDNLVLPRAFILPGEISCSAAIDIARSVVRRAERNIWRIVRQGYSQNPVIPRYINRLSFFLFLLARWAEQNEGKQAKLAKHNQP
jgi:cob(I)alamin adenosyltransferase